MCNKPMVGTVWEEHAGCTSAGTGFLDEGWQQHHWWRKSMMLKAWASPNAPKRLSCSCWPRRSSPLKGHWWASLQHHHPRVTWAEPPHWPWDVSPATSSGSQGRERPFGKQSSHRDTAACCWRLMLFPTLKISNFFLKNRTANLVKK